MSEKLVIISHVVTKAVIEGFIPAAKALNCEIWLLTDQPESYHRYLKNSLVKVLPCDVFNPLEIIERINLEVGHPDGIFSNSDHLQSAVAVCANYFGLPGKSIEACLWSKNKYLMRKQLKKQNLEKLFFCTVNNSRELENLASQLIPWPVVAKPVKGVASIDVAKINDFSDLESYCSELWKKSKQAILIEEFIESPVFSVETLDNQVLGGFETQLGDPPFFIETGAKWLPSLPAHHTEQLLPMLKALKINFGACHTEYFIRAGKVILVEVNYRSVGDGKEFLLDKLASGNYFTQVIANCLGFENIQLTVKDCLARIDYSIAKKSGNIKSLPADVSTKQTCFYGVRDCGERVNITNSNKDYVGIGFSIAEHGETLVCMNKEAEICIETSVEDKLFKRVMDTLIREDFCQAAQSIKSIKNKSGTDKLEVRLLDKHKLIVPVKKSNVMQEWEFLGGSVCLASENQTGEVTSIASCLNFIAEHSALDNAQFTNFIKEYETALSHKLISDQQQNKYLQACNTSDRQDHWHAQLAHFEQLASYLDHPYYPTAKAKNGLTNEDLEAFSIEFGAEFALNTIAIDKAMLNKQGCLPAWWPKPSAVGLTEALDNTHQVILIHPLVDLSEITVGEKGRPYGSFKPTLSFRTVINIDHPDFHIKLPVPIRTLGYKNLRTIKSSTINDGHQMQSLLESILCDEPALKEKILLTDESTGHYVTEQPYLSNIIRVYPLEGQAVVCPVAGLSALIDPKNIVSNSLANQYFGTIEQFLSDYFEITMAFHLKLLIQKGIALESNQQNTSLVITNHQLKLLFKDNDAGRIENEYCLKSNKKHLVYLNNMLDSRILSATFDDLINMFITITLQLNCVSVIEGVHNWDERFNKKQAYSVLKKIIQKHAESEVETAEHRKRVDALYNKLFDQQYLPLKGLLSAGSVLDKTQTRATDINKYYLNNCPNFFIE